MRSVSLSGDSRNPDIHDGREEGQNRELSQSGATDPTEQEVEAMMPAILEVVLSEPYDESSTVPAAEVLGDDWELPEGFVWEYRDALDGGGSVSMGPDGTRHSQTILPTRSRRAVGPWEVVRERTVLDV